MRRYANPKRTGGLLKSRGNPRPSVPAGRGAPPQQYGIDSDFGTPNLPPVIVRYGPNSDVTDTPASRVATGRIPPTGAGTVRYTASVDGDPIRYPMIDRAGKWEQHEPAFTYPNKAVAKSGPSQTPKQAHLTRTGKKTGD
jgi:hypothetical protein